MERLSNLSHPDARHDWLWAASADPNCDDDGSGTSSCVSETGGNCAGDKIAEGDTGTSIPETGPDTGDGNGGGSGGVVYPLAV